MYIVHCSETSNALHASAQCEHKRLQMLLETVPVDIVHYAIRLLKNTTSTVQASHSASIFINIFKLPLVYVSVCSS